MSPRPPAGAVVTGRTVGLITALVVCSCLLMGRVARAQLPLSREYQIKAAFLFNFVKFVEWRDDALAPPTEPIEICVLGEDPFGAALDSIQGKAVKGRNVQVRRLASAEGLRQCHVAFISSSERERLPEVLKSLESANVLTVGDFESFSQSGGVINFVTERNKVRFEINVTAAERAGLRISSKLLNLAKVVR